MVVKDRKKPDRKKNYLVEMPELSNFRHMTLSGILVGLHDETLQATPKIVKIALFQGRLKDTILLTSAKFQSY